VFAGGCISNAVVGVWEGMDVLVYAFIAEEVQSSLGWPNQHYGSRQMKTSSHWLANNFVSWYMTSSTATTEQCMLRLAFHCYMQVRRPLQLRERAQHLACHPA
jgi:hypothetical protein